MKVGSEKKMTSKLTQENPILELRENKRLEADPYFKAQLFGPYFLSCRSFFEGEDSLF